MPGRHKSVAEEQHNLMPGAHTAARHRSDTGHRAPQALHRARRRAGVQPSYLLQAHVRKRGSLLRWHTGRGGSHSPQLTPRERRMLTFPRGALHTPGCPCGGHQGSDLELRQQKVLSCKCFCLSAFISLRVQS